MNRERYLLCGLMLLVSGLYYPIAQANSPTPKLMSHNMYGTISAGVDFIRTNGNQSVSFLVPYQEYFTGKQSYKSSGSVGIGLGIERPVNANWLWQLGVAGYFNTAVNADGHLLEYGLADYDNFIYNYHVQSSRVVAAGKLLTTYEQYHPYLSGELGAAFNRSYAYNEMSLLAEELPMAPFANNTQSAFSWGIGLGVDMDIHSGFRLGLGYQFADLGKASLGISPVQETNETLSIRHLYDNQVRIQLTALI